MKLETITDESMERFVGERLALNPEASSAEMAVRWRSRRGETLSAEELALLAEAYERQAPAAHKGNAAQREAQHRIDSPPFRVWKQEIVAFVAVLVPFVFPVETVNMIVRGDGVVTGGMYFSLTGVLGGLVGVVLALVILRLAMQDNSVGRVKMGHAALGGVFLLLGAYHLLHGVGILHTLGIFRLA